MRLLTAHKILIASAVLLGVLLTVRSVVLFATNHVTSDLLYALGELSFTVVLAFYLRALWRR